jgi:hypothetical protein
MKEKKVQGLSARELLEGVYNTFKKNGKEIKLLSKAMPEIACDFDRAGYTKYESAVILEINGKKWAVSLGIACGGYLADPYNCDIAAVKLSENISSEEEVVKEIYDALERNKYFRHSLIYAMADGNLCVNKSGVFSEKVFEILDSRIQTYIAQDLEIDSQYITLNLRPVVTSAVRYKREFVNVLYTTFRAIIAS